jgi:hypothetical protein
VTAPLGYATATIAGLDLSTETSPPRAYVNYLSSPDTQRNGYL